MSRQLTIAQNALLAAREELARRPDFNAHDDQISRALLAIGTVRYNITHEECPPIPDLSAAPPAAQNLRERIAGRTAHARRVRAAAMLHILGANEGTISQTAVALGITRQHLHREIAALRKVTAN